MGYESNESLKEVPYSEYVILAGGGAHRSTVPDIARFLTAHWGFPINHMNPLNKNLRSEFQRIRWTSEDKETNIAWVGLRYLKRGSVLCWSTESGPPDTVQQSDFYLKNEPG